MDLSWVHFVTEVGCTRYGVRILYEEWLLLLLIFIFMGDRSVNRGWVTGLGHVNSWQPGKAKNLLFISWRWRRKEKRWWSGAAVIGTAESRARKFKVLKNVEKSGPELFHYLFPCWEVHHICYFWDLFVYVIYFLELILHLRVWNGKRAFFYAKPCRKEWNPVFMTITRATFLC